MMKNTEFVNKVLEIASSNPTYRTRGDGSDGTCDCVGLIMGAVGKKYPMHSTNYFARYEMEGLLPLSDWRELIVGDLVYKWRDGNNSLNARYKPGGRYYTGDMMDYYHVGVVTSIKPLVITHCTESDNVNGIARDNSIKGWSLHGQLIGIEYEEGETMTSKKLAMVVADSGFTVNVRKRPDKAAPILFAVPIGEIVEVTEKADGWATVLYNGQRGYMMSEFLDFSQSEVVEIEDEFITVTIPKGAANALFEALKGVSM